MQPPGPTATGPYGAPSHAAAPPSVPFHPTPGVRFTWKMYPDTPKPAAKSSVASLGTSSNSGRRPAFSHYTLPPLVVPLACVFSPLHVDANAAPPPLLPGNQLQRCRCGAAWSDACRIDVQSRFWACSMCFNRNPLPPDFDSSQPHPVTQHKIVDYTFGYKAPAAPSLNVSNLAPAYIFVVDLCIPADELQALKSSLGASIQRIPQNAVVGFIGIGRSLTLWELGFETFNKSYSFRGNRSFSKPELLQLLGLTSNSDAANKSGSQSATGGSAAAAQNTSILGRFLVPFSQCEFALTTLVDDLTVDPFFVPAAERPQRATGVALDVATTLMELSGAAGVPGGRIIVLTGGPCTRGPGAIVGVKKNEMIRTYRDFMDGNTPLYENARCFYDGLATRLSECRATCDVFIASLDQTGLTEMKHLTDATGGILVCADLFSQALFVNSFERYVDRVITATSSSARGCGTVGYGVRIDAYTTPNTAISGALGLTRVPGRPVGGDATNGAGGGGGATASKSFLSGVADALGVSEASAKPTTTSTAGGANVIAPPAPLYAVQPPSTATKRMISANAIGFCDTTSWLLSSCDPDLTLTVLFDTETLETPQQPQPGGALTNGVRVIQFVVSYVTVTGENRVRVVTTTQPVAAVDNAALLTQTEAFDQSVAAAVLARMAVDGIAEHSNYFDTARKWVDRTLVRFVKKVGTYSVGQPNTLRLARCYSLLPTLLFNFRRSEYFMYLNISPDEATFKQHYLLRESVESVLLMMQPTVDTYTMQEPFATPALLDSSSVVPDRVLLLDSYFNVHVLIGNVLHEWQKAGYHLKEEFAHVKQVLDQPVTDANSILAVRFPYPRFSVTDQYGSEARHVLTKLNPSVTHNSGVADSRAAAAGGNGGQPSQEVIYTDDASVQRFMETLKAAVVAADS